MIRLELVLVAVAVACALGTVTSQHRARKLFNDLEQEQRLARQVDVEWGQLQLEQSTWAMHPRVEKIAAHYLGMRVPPASRVRVVEPETR